MGDLTGEPIPGATPQDAIKPLSVSAESHLAEQQQLRKTTISATVNKRFPHKDYIEEGKRIEKSKKRTST